MATLYSYALTSIADVKETLGIDVGNTTKDNLIIRKINQATDMIEKYCGGRRFSEDTYIDEEYDATNSNQLALRNYPITNIVSLSYRDSSLNENSWEIVDADRYFVDQNAGVIDLTFNARGRWNRYKVTYDAGYGTIPADLAEACVTLVAYLYENATSGTGIKKKQEGSRSIEYFDVNASSSGDNGILGQLNIDDILNTYAKYPLTEK